MATHTAGRTGGIELVLVAVAVLLLLPSGTEARIHDLTISSDARRVFGIEPFGFLVGGTIDLDVTGFRLKNKVRPLTLR